MGATLSLLHFDEIAFTNYNWIVVPTATNAMIKASEQVRKTGLPSPIIYTTTAGNPDTKEGNYALGIFEAATPFAETMYDLQNRDALIELIERSGSRKMLFLEFSYRQLGKTDQWFHEVASRNASSQDDINRDLLNIWQSSTDNSVIPKDLLHKIRQSQRDPSHTDLSDGFVVRWYVDRDIVKTPYFAERPMIMGMDTSENVGRDFTTFCILDPRDMSVMAICRCNESNTMQVARHVFTLLRRYPKLVWIPERNNTGTGIIDFVIEQLQKVNINPYTRIYNEVVQNYGDPKYKNVNIYAYQDIYGKDRAVFGFRTSGSTSSGTSRNLLYKVTMMKALEMNHSKIYDRSLISEFCNLTERNGRIDHPVGLHDDTAISFLLSSFLVFFGRNLHLYGIDSTQVLQEVTIGNNTHTRAQQAEQISIQRRIRELEELLATNPAHIIRESYKRELSNLVPLVNDEALNIEPIAVSQVERQEQEIDNRPRKATVQGLRSFASRWGRMR